MSWLSPDSFLWLLAAPVVFLLYLLRGRSEPTPTATMFLWRRAIAHRSPWRRLRPWVSAGWRAGVVVLLVLALASPLLGPRDAKPRTFVIVLDGTASMKATDVAASRFDAAQAAALAQLENLGPLDRVGVVVVGSSPQILLRPSDNSETIRTALEEATAKDVAGDISDGIRVADEMMRDTKSATILAFTDLAVSSKTKATLNVYAAAAKQPHNAAVVAIAARPMPPADSPAGSATASGSTADVVARVQATPGITSVRFRWKLNDNVVADSRIELVDGEAIVTRRFEDAGVVTLELIDADQLAADNSASVSLTDLNDTRSGVATASHVFVGAADGVLVSPTNVERKIEKATGGRKQAVGPLDQVGVWKWRSNGSETLWHVSLLSPDESLLSGDLQAGPIEIQAGQIPAAPVQGWFFLIAMLTWGAEWVAFILGVTE